MPVTDPFHLSSVMNHSKPPATSPRYRLVRFSNLLLEFSPLVWK